MTGNWKSILNASSDVELCNKLFFGIECMNRIAHKKKVNCIRSYWGLHSFRDILLLFHAQFYTLRSVHKIALNGRWNLNGIFWCDEANRDLESIAGKRVENFYETINKISDSKKNKLLHILWMLFYQGLNTNELLLFTHRYFTNSLKYFS